MLTHLQIRDFAIAECGRSRVRRRLYGTDRRNRRGQVHPDRCAAAGSGRPRRQRRRAPRRRTRRSHRRPSPLRVTRAALRLAGRAIDRTRRRVPFAPRRRRRRPRPRLPERPVRTRAIAARAGRAARRRSRPARIPVARAQRAPARDARRQRQAAGRRGTGRGRPAVAWRALDKERREFEQRCATATLGSTCCGTTSRNSMHSMPAAAKPMRCSPNARASRRVQGSPRARRAWRSCSTREDDGASRRWRARSPSCVLCCRWMHRWAKLGRARRSADRVSRGRIGAASLRRASRCRPGTPGVGRVTAGRNRSDRAQASLWSRGVAGVARHRCRPSCAICATSRESHAELDARLQMAQRDYVELAAQLTRVRREFATQLDRRVAGLLQELGMRRRPVRYPGRPARPARAQRGGQRRSRVPGQRESRTAAATTREGCVGGRTVSDQPRAPGRDATGRTPALPRLRRGRRGRRRRGCGQGRSSARALATRAQVLCVTHLPQVAAQAEHQVARHETQRDAADPHAARKPRRCGARRGNRADARRHDRLPHARASMRAKCSSRPRLGRRRVRRCRYFAAASRGKGSSRARSGRARSASGRRS